MAGGRPSNSSADYVRAALAIVDEEGLEALTTRTLGERMGVHGTAVYRHFPNREDLITAMLNEVIGQVSDASVSDDPDPRTRLHTMLRTARAKLAEHPNLVIPLVTSNGLIPRGAEITLRVLADLEAMGLHGSSLAVAHQMLESYLVGSTAFDYAGAPDHLEMRRVRRRMLAHEAYDPLTRQADQIGELNQEAFELGCTALLNMCEQLAAQQPA